MIPQMNIQGTATAQVCAASDTGAEPEADPGAADDFRKALRTGTEGRHGPGPGGKPGARTGPKTAADDEMASQGLGVAVPIAADTPSAPPTAASNEAQALREKAEPPNPDGSIGTALGADGRAVAVAQSVADEGSAQAGLATAALLQVQPAAVAIRAPGSTGLDPLVPPMPAHSASFAAQHGTFATKIAASPSGDQRYSEPDQGAAAPSPGQTSVNRGVGEQNVAQDLAASASLADPQADAASVQANAAQQTSPRKDVSLRGTISQAAAILIWQASIGAEASAAFKPTAPLLTQPNPPASPPIAATPTLGPILLTDPVLQAQLQNLQPVGDEVPPPPAAETPSGAASADSTLQLPGPGALSAFALDAALTKPAVPATALPTPFHPFVASIRLHAAAHEHLAAGSAGAELLLHPADLGRIRFAMSGIGDQLTITIAAENPGTLQLLQRHVTDLRAELAREGLGQAALSFAGPGPGNSGGQGARDQPLTAPPTAEPTDLAPPTPPPPVAIAPQTGGGLDLRL